MIHTASLVHDDVLDDCDIRRGRGLGSHVRLEVCEVNVWWLMFGFLFQGRLL